MTRKHYKLYKSYLTNRYQRTLLCNENGNITTSTRAKVEHGVPQVSVLGPLFLLIFINDKPKFERNKSVPILFAYDTSILLSHSNPTGFSNNFNTVFKILCDWFYKTLLYVFFWVFPRRPIVVCRRFGTLYRFHLQGLDVEYEV